MKEDGAIRVFLYIALPLCTYHLYNIGTKKLNKPADNIPYKVDTKTTLKIRKV